jgi:hypothetical protein
MGDKIMGVAMVAVLLAGLGDMLMHVSGTNAVFQGVGGLVNSTYSAAAGSYSSSPN